MLSSRMVTVMSKRAGPGQLLPVLVRAQRELEDHHRQVGHGRVEIGAPELIVERREQQRRRLAADARDREQQAGDDAAARRRIEDADDGAPGIGAERGGGSPSCPCGTRFSMSSVVRKRHRNRDDGERQRAGDRREMPHAAPR